MAKGFAIHNAITDHGGVVPSTQSRSSQMGNLFVRAGDGHMCPKCRCWSVVIKSHDLMCAEKTGGFNLVNYRHSSGVYHEQETEDLHRRI